MLLMKKGKRPMNETPADRIGLKLEDPPLTVVRCGVPVCPTCATVRENEAGEIRELRLKLSQTEEVLVRQEGSYETSSETNNVLRQTFLQLKSDNEILLDDAKRLRIERDKALQSVAYLKAQYEALQEQFSLSNG